MPHPTKRIYLPPAVRSSERRAAQRHECLDLTRCQVPAAGEQFWARIRNLTVGSVGLVLDRPLQPGTCLMIDLGGGPGPALVTVVHATRYASGGWLVGGRLERPLTERELESLLRQGW